MGKRQSDARRLRGKRVSGNEAIEDAYDRISDAFMGMGFMVAPRPVYFVDDNRRRAHATADLLDSDANVIVSSSRPWPTLAAALNELVALGKRYLADQDQKAKAEQQAAEAS